LIRGFRNRLPFWPDKPPEHFLGSLVVIESGMIDGVIPVFTLVDGQQRLTTISLLLNGLYEYVAKRATYPQLMNRIRRMLVNDVDAQRDVYLKILPTTKYGDRMVYQRLIEGKGIAENDATLSSKIYQAYAFLRREVERQIAAGRIEPERFYRVIITCFQVVFINLSQDESPYRIFESLNGKGKPLTQADLVRNYKKPVKPLRL
jgi:hypothetical protein